jgi:hypothetical protein
MDNLGNGITPLSILLLVALITFIGIMLWGFKVPKLKGLGVAMTSIGVTVLLVMVVLLAAVPAQVTPPTTHDATFDILAVTPTHGNYTQATKTITIIVDVNTTTPSLNNSATHLFVNFTVQRTDAGETTDIKTITASYAPASITDTITTDVFSVAKPAADGTPEVNWTMTTNAGVATSTRTLSAQEGLTPYETGNVAVNIVWNAAAFGASQIAANDVVNCGVLTVGGVAYQLQVLVHAVWT